ncbi:MAG: hypothetical protein EBU46_17905, partial [Nitrosomonadaceae bacterium]|nr:hypothetical protein [Nitrosomonadaceae bacterium]
SNMFESVEDQGDYSDGGNDGDYGDGDYGDSGALAAAGRAAEAPAAARQEDAGKRRSGFMASLLGDE